MQEVHGRTQLLILRWSLFAVVGYLFWLSAGHAIAARAILLTLLAISNVALHLIPGESWRRPAVLSVLVLFDVGVLSAALHWSGRADSEFYLGYFTVLAVVALGSSLRWVAIAVAGVVVAYGSLLYLREGTELLRNSAHLMRLSFLLTAGIVHGSVAMHGRRRVREAELEQRLHRWIRALTAFCSGPAKSRALVREVLEDLQKVMPEAVRISVVRLVGGDAQVMISSDDRELDWLTLDLARYPELVQAARSGAPFAIDEISSHPTMATVRNHLGELPFSSLLVCPVSLQDQVMGYMMLRVARKRGGFTREEMDYCSGVAEAIAAALRLEDFRSIVQQAEEENELYMEILNNIQTGICVLEMSDLEDVETLVIVGANPVAERIIGVEVQHLYARQVSESLPRLAKARLVEACPEVIRSGRAKDLGRLSYSDDLDLSVRVFPLPDDRVGISLEPVIAPWTSHERVRNGTQRLPEADAEEDPHAARSIAFPGRRAASG